MDATTPPRGDDEPTPAEPAGLQPRSEPARQSGEGRSTAVGAASAHEVSSPPPSSPPASADGPEDPTAPDTAVEATLAAGPAGSRPEEPVVPTANPDEVRVSAPAAAETEAPAGGPAGQAPAPAPTGDGRHPAAQSASTAASAPDVVYVAAPTPPKKKGNRGIGVLLAALSTVLFLLLYLAVVVLINIVQGRGGSVEFLQRLEFYIPVLLYAIGFMLLAMIVNRAGWWSFVLGSFFVGAFVYLGTVGVLLLSEASRLTPEAAVLAFRSLLISPIVVAAGLVAREVALWVGAAISARGRRIKAKNAEARAQFDREQAEHRAEIERSGAVVRPA